MSKRQANLRAHGCTHLKHPDECCPGMHVCNHGVTCKHGSCCYECYDTKCPEGVKDAEEAAMRGLKFHELAGSAPEWLPITSGEDGGGYRNFLDGKAIHCGTGLELQAKEYTTVKYNGNEFEGWRRLASGIDVRYEMTWFMGTRVGMLHLDTGSYNFEQKLDRSMRFRWPKKE